MINQIERGKSAPIARQSDKPFQMRQHPRGKGSFYL